MTEQARDQSTFTGKRWLGSNPKSKQQDDATMTGAGAGAEQVENKFRAGQDKQNHIQSETTR